MPTLRIAPSKGWVPLRLNELWEYRELLYFLVWRDIKVRYKQTALGAAWAIIQPFCTMVVFSLFFGHLGKMPSDGIPYPIFAFAALVPWGFFANGLSQSSNSLVGSSHLITKVYFPRLIVPLGAVFSGIVDFLVAFAVLPVALATLAACLRQYPLGAFRVMIFAAPTLLLLTGAGMPPTLAWLRRS